MIRRLARFLGYGIFWGWNLLFFAFLVFGLGPEVLFGIVRAGWLGIIPTGFAVSATLLMLIPALGMILGAWKLRTDPGRLMSMFYGVQAPLMLICFMRLFAFQQLTLATGLLLGGFAVGALCLLRTILVGWEEPTPTAQLARLSGQTVYALIGLWTAVAIGVFAFPLAFLALGELLENAHRLIFRPHAWIFAAFFGSTMGVLAVFPLAMIGIALRAWSLVARSTSDTVGPTPAAVVTGLTALAVGCATMLAMGQSQHRAFALLEGDRTSALAHSETIRRGLLDARLRQYRFLATEDEMRDAGEEVWGEAFNTESVAAMGGALARATYAPFLYRPVESRWADLAAAERAYADFFDVPMTRAERGALVSAEESTWMWSRAAASAADVGQQRVWLEQQDVDIEAHGDHATVTVHDVYRNATFASREVVVYFSLPESAALTGLWLGSTPDRDEAFTHVLAPRGAAQQVYREQVRVNRDPALLEQVGPRQYRLRAFPILPREGRIDDLDSVGELGPAFHLWMELQVLSVEAGAEAAWPMPHEAEIRNLYWDARTTRTLNGGPGSWDGWLPERVEGAGAPEAHVVAVGDSVVQLTPSAPGPVRIPDGAVVVVDTTRSMEPRRGEIAAALADLGVGAPLGVGPDGVAAYESFDPATHGFWGSASMVQMLTALEGHPGVADAPALVLITDSTTYDQATDRGSRTEGFELPTLHLVHVDGLPMAYSDAVLDTLTAYGGRVGSTVAEAFTAGGSDGWSVALLDDGRAADAPDASLAALAARAVIHERAGWADPGEVDDLDALHALAKQFDLVTPYSSMIVLVNEGQLERLKKLTEGDDRFDREAEGEAVPEPSSLDMGLTSTPEPEEWLLLGCVLAMLAEATRRRRLGLANVHA